MMLKINSSGKYSVSESNEFLLGKVESLWAVNSSSNHVSSNSLNDRAKIRIKEREIPSSKIFDD